MLCNEKNKIVLRGTTMCGLVRFVYVVLLFVFSGNLYSQTPLFSRQSSSVKYGVAVSGVSFFRNDEYSSRVVDDYTLPGYRLSVSLQAESAPYFSVSLGLENLYYYGANRYPSALAYRDLPYWTGQDDGRFMKLFPLVRMTFCPNENFSFVLGSFPRGLYNGVLEPLYNPTLEYVSDPHRGVVMRYEGCVYQMTTSIDWQSFIFHHERHPEAFTFFHRSDICLLSSSSPLWGDLQLIASHRGGKINDVVPDTVHTHLNAAVGVHTNIATSLIGQPYVYLSAYGLFYLQRGEHYVSSRGVGMYFQSKLKYRHLSFSLDGMWGKGYASPWGIPFSRAFDKNDKYYNSSRLVSYIHPYASYAFAMNTFVFRAELGGYFLPYLKSDSFSHYMDLSIGVNLQELFSK